MKIYFLIFDKVEELDLVGSWEFIGLLAAKWFCELPKLVSLNSMMPSGEHGMRFSADIHIAEKIYPDILIIPGGSGARLAMEDPKVIEYLQVASDRCDAVLSICTAIFLMQKAGLLDGKKVTTHWAFIEQLKEDKSVDVIEERFIHDGHIWTSAGVSAGMDMTLAFIADYFGDTVAAQIQLEAEYYPENKKYIDPKDSSKLPAYIKKLQQ